MSLFGRDRSRAQGAASRPRDLPDDGIAGNDRESRSAKSGVRRGEDIVTYWSRLRNGRRFPARADLDSVRIAADWPNSIVVRCRRGSRVLEPEMSFPRVPDEPGLTGSSGGFALSPMVLQWVLALAGEAVQGECPMHDVESFPSQDGSTQYRAVALPLSDDQQGIDHILCHVGPAP